MTGAEPPFRPGATSTTTYAYRSWPTCDEFCHPMQGVHSKTCHRLWFEALCRALGMP